MNVEVYPVPSKGRGLEAGITLACCKLIHVQVIISRFGKIKEVSSNQGNGRILENPGFEQRRRKELSHSAKF